MKITGKFWLKGGQTISETIDVGEDEEKIEEIGRTVNAIREATAKTFKIPLQHASMDFGQLTLRVDDVSAIWFKEAQK